jgi:ribonuclease VapC
MVIDSSAIIAILLNENERGRFLDLILAAEKRLISAGTVVEAGIVLEYRSSLIAVREFDLFLYQAGIEIVAFDTDQADRARVAYRKYGKGRHPAALNFGDCFTHALASVSGEPVLAKSEEFARAGLSVCK